MCKWIMSTCSFCCLQKRSISDYVGIIKGRTAIRVLNKFRQLRKKLYWGNHFWAKGYCVDTVGLDADMIRKYVKYQERKEKRHEQLYLFSVLVLTGTASLPLSGVSNTVSSGVGYLLTSTAFEMST